MKRYFYWVLTALAALAILSCGGPEPDPSGNETPAVVSFSPQPGSLAFPKEGGSQEIALTTDSKAWKVSLTGSWATVSPSQGSGNARLNVTVAPNEGERRMLTLSFQDTNGAKGTVSVSVTQEEAPTSTALTPAPAAFDGNKRSDLTYQLLIYSFADSDGDGIGDLNGIVSKLDYLDDLGVTALWLSPAHPTSSYHGYDVNDYSKINPLYSSGKTAESAEAEFKNLIEKAHEKGIKIYMDYVLNHSGRDNVWFKDAISSTASPYRGYYVLSTDPDQDVATGKIDNYAGAKTPGMGSWHSAGGSVGYKGRLHFKLDWTGSAKTVTVTETAEAPQSSNPSASKWLWIGSVGAVGLYETSSNIFEITLDVDTDWGFLIRTSTTTWDNGTKYGAKAGGSKITFGTPLILDNVTAADITFGAPTWYFASFDASMPDLDYGPYATASASPAFQAIASTADKWIRLGVDGFRLDAVIWIYQTNNGEANPTFLKQWYDRCNATYRAAGHTDDIFMVGEVWMDHSQEKNYYKGINSTFEFGYWPLLKNAVASGRGSAYASGVIGFINEHKVVRSDAITSIFMTNHDQDRAANDLGRNLAREKQAAAMLLTTAGKPFVYQGEELGYWGTKSGGDEYVRAPILWDKAGKDCAKKGPNGKVDAAMLTAAISVEAQLADEASLLQVYRTFARLRNTYPALAKGEMTVASGISNPSVAAWYMSSGSQKLLVVHNVATTPRTVSVSDSMDKPVALLGSGSRDRNTLTLEAGSSVVFEL
ncbi:MAG: alpha-amylase [Bacteroidales bacterium]|nr:alpha-amylase [Bacteroidales bacterium]